MNSVDNPIITQTSGAQVSTDAGGDDDDMTIVYALGGVCGILVAGIFVYTAYIPTTAKNRDLRYCMCESRDGKVQERIGEASEMELGHYDSPRQQPAPPSKREILRIDSFDEPPTPRTGGEVTTAGYGGVEVLDVNHHISEEGGAPVENPPEMYHKVKFT